MNSKKIGDYMPVLFFGVIVLVVVSAVIARNFTDTEPTGQNWNKAQDSVKTEPQTESQTVNLGLSRGNYNPQVITVAYGKPVTIQNDGTLAGCALYMSQPQLGISTNFARNKDYTFTPMQRGSFRFACSMNMYSGTLNVV